MDNIRPKRGKFFYGWWIVIASALLHFLSGGAFYYGFSVFFNPIKDTFGWTSAVTSIAFTLRGFETGVLAPVAGILVDRVGPRRLLITGWSIIGVGFILMSRIDSLVAFYGSFVLIATGMSLGSGVVMNTAIANWFTRKRSRALALTFIGPGASGLLAPLLALSINLIGWRDTLVVTGIALLATGIPLSLIIRHKPYPYGYLPDGEVRATISEEAEAAGNNPRPSKQPADTGSDVTGFTAKEALRTRAFWMLALVFSFQQIGTSAVTVHIVPFLESVKVSTAIAATAVTGMTLFSLVGRLGFGLIGDFTNKRYLIAIAITLQTIGILIFSYVGNGSTWLIILFLLTYGAGFGGPIPLRAALQADFFGVKSFGTTMGLMSMIIMLGGLASPVIAGWIFDTSGSYVLAWQLFALTGVPGIALILLARPPGDKQEGWLRAN
ncbi:MAG: MFS transporter [Dehalococcoidales bacterium]|nr:MFS transporter [Dehalococcoidales bacterium]